MFSRVINKMKVINEMTATGDQKTKIPEKKVELEKLDKACVSGNCIQGIHELCFPFTLHLFQCAKYSFFSLNFPTSMEGTLERRLNRSKY